MVRIKLPFILISIFISLPLSHAHTKNTTAHIAVIDSQAGEPYSTIRSYFYKQLKHRNWIAGENLKVTEYSIGNKPDTISNIWKYDIQNSDIHVVYVSGTMATIGAKKYLFDKNVKVIFAAPTDPIGIGVIDNFDVPPSHNFTGVCYTVNVDRRLQFLKTLVPHVKKIGYVYADMPQSISYLSWLREELAKPEFKGVQLVTAKVPFVDSDGGQIRMAMLAGEHIKSMNPDVDVFMSPSDQMGTQKPFAETVVKFATKPLIGIGKKDITENWGPVASIFGSLDDIGTQTANMLADVLEEKDFKSIYPRRPREGIALDLRKVKKYKLPNPPESLIERAKQEQALID